MEITVVNFEQLLAVASDKGLVISSASNSIQVAKGDVRVLLHLVEELQFVVLGLEVFRLVGSKTVADVDLIADLGAVGGQWNARVSTTATAARDILGRWPDDVEVVEVVLLAPDQRNR